MAAAAQPVMEREVVKCGACLLTQFMTRNELCRRCHIALRPQLVMPPKAEVVEMPKPSAASDIDRRFAQSLRLIRLAQGLSQRDLSKRMITPRTYISKMENGGVIPTLRNLPRFAKALDVSMLELVMLATL